MGRRGQINIADERFFFVTTAVVRHTKVFGNNIYSELLVKSIKHYQFKYKFDILAYVIMPHIIIGLLKLNQNLERFQVL